MFGVPSSAFVVAVVPFEEELDEFHNGENLSPWTGPIHGRATSTPATETKSVPTPQPLWVASLVGGVYILATLAVVFYGVPNSGNPGSVRSVFGNAFIDTPLRITAQIAALWPVGDVRPESGGTDAHERSARRHFLGNCGDGSELFCFASIGDLDWSLVCARPFLHIDRLVSGLGPLLGAELSSRLAFSALVAEGMHTRAGFKLLPTRESGVEKSAGLRSLV